MPQDVSLVMPFPRRVAPDLQGVVTRNLSWARTQGLLPTRAAEQRYLSSQSGEVAAWFCPDPADDLDLSFDIIGWFFLFDDRFDVPAERGVGGAWSVCTALVDFLHRAAEPPASPIADAFAELWRRESDGMSAGWRRRAVLAWQEYFTSYLIRPSRAD